jgi:F-type H+-transporting ATPase subunit gamma
MSQLIQMRQRIRAIETIKKITHAMRLISMSSHARLKNKQESFEAYTKNLRKLLARIQNSVIQSPTLQRVDAPDKPEKILICIISSQKGLCGTFNSMLLYYFRTYIKSFGSENISLFLVGKKIIDALSDAYKDQIIATEPTFTLRTVPPILEKIKAQIPSFDRVIVINNILKSFFIQEPRATTIMPLEIGESGQQTENFSEYMWEIPAQTILDTLMNHYKEAAIEQLLLQSLLAEHAARFIAMDNSTRNAQNLLDEKKRQYNKLRQANITKELTEVSGIFTM